MTCFILPLILEARKNVRIQIAEDVYIQIQMISARPSHSERRNQRPAVLTPTSLGGTKRVSHSAAYLSIQNYVEVDRRA